MGINGKIFVIRKNNQYKKISEKKQHFNNIRNLKKKKLK